MCYYVLWGRDFFWFCDRSNGTSELCFFWHLTPVSSYHCSDFSHPQRLSALDHTAQLECHICDPIFYCCCSRSGIILARPLYALYNFTECSLDVFSVCRDMYVTFCIYLLMCCWKMRKRKFFKSLKMVNHMQIYAKRVMLYITHKCNERGG